MDSFGPLEPILQDPDVMEIMINGPHEIYVEKHGKLILTDAKFEDSEQLMHLIQHIVEPVGRVVNESNPIVDARLADGSRVNIVIPPIALNGPVMTIRKFQRDNLTWDELIGYGSVNDQMVQFLKACVQANLNMVVAGGTGSGKTTIFNAMAEFIRDDERLVVVERAAELQLKKKHLVRLEARPANIEGRGEVTLRDLVINAMKMRPERIILGEVLGGEVIDVIQAMNTGHDGSMFTIHANSPRDALARLEVMATMAGLDIPLLSIREQLASAIDVIVQQMRLRDGSRRILSITEVIGMKNNAIEIADIFTFEQTDVVDGRIIGHFTPTGHKPRFLQSAPDVFTFSDDFFTPVTS